MPVLRHCRSQSQQQPCTKATNANRHCTRATIVLKPGSFHEKRLLVYYVRWKIGFDILRADSFLSAPTNVEIIGRPFLPRRCRARGSANLVVPRTLYASAETSLTQSEQGAKQGIALPCKLLNLRPWQLRCFNSAKSMDAFGMNVLHLLP